MPLFLVCSIERERLEMLFAIVTDYIKLDSFLKAVNVVGSGGEAKIVIADGEVMVNGQPELRRGRKLYPKDTVTFAGKNYQIGTDA